MPSIITQYGPRMDLMEYFIGIYIGSMSQRNSGEGNRYVGYKFFDI